MRDEMDGRIWAEHHEQFSKDLGRLFDMFAQIFRKLVQIEYEAPWELGTARRRNRP